jgi:hypothetical protein
MNGENIVMVDVQQFFFWQARLCHVRQKFLVPMSPYGLAKILLYFSQS